MKYVQVHFPETRHHLLFHVAMETEEVDWQLLLGCRAGLATQDRGEERDEKLHCLTARYEDNQLLTSIELQKTRRKFIKQVTELKTSILFIKNSQFLFFLITFQSSQSWTEHLRAHVCMSVLALHLASINAARQTRRNLLGTNTIYCCSLSGTT